MWASDQILNRNSTIRSIQKGNAMKNLKSKLTLAAALTLAMATLAPLAQAADPKPDTEISFNAAVSSEYRYRGLSQSRLKPALSGGADLVNNPTGLYVGTWLSTIKWIKDLGGDGQVEMDIYGGKRGEISSGISYDVGGLYYLYPSNSLNPSANTFEVYGQVGMGPGYIKYSHSTTNLFGTADSKGSGYLDLGANIEVGEGLVLNLHAGRQRVAHNGIYTYNDYKIGVTKDLGFASIALAVIGSDTDAYVSPVNGKNLGKAAAVLSLSKTF
jgi:uncharacterized protein (TIGR02001 family)